MEWANNAEHHTRFRNILSSDRTGKNYPHDWLPQSRHAPSDNNYNDIVNINELVFIHASNISLIAFIDRSRLLVNVSDFWLKLKTFGHQWQWIGKHPSSMVDSSITIDGITKRWNDGSACVTSHTIQWPKTDLKPNIVRWIPKNWDNHWLLASTMHVCLTCM